MPAIAPSTVTRMAAAAVAAAGRCSLSSVAIPKRSQNIVHLDQFMTRADLLIKKGGQQKAVTPSSSSSSSTFTTTTAQQQQPPPLQRGSMDVQIGPS
jgi:cellulase/cellobiase CelA1